MCTVMVALTLIITTNAMMKHELKPQIATRVIEGLSVLDEDDLNDEAAFESEIRTMTFFNLTNAYELQTQTPAPKPRFETVTVTFNKTWEYFDYKFVDEGRGYEYTEFFRYDAITPSDWNLEIVNINPVYLGSFYCAPCHPHASRQQLMANPDLVRLVVRLAALGAPSEQSLFAGLSGTALGLVYSSVLVAGVDAKFSPLVAVSIAT